MDRVYANRESAASTSVSENEKIKQILKEYSIEALRIERIRSVYKVTAENRTYCLKKIKHTGSFKVEKGYALSKHLIGNGFYGIVKYIKTKNHQISIKDKHNIYYVTNWIKGREIRFGSREEVQKCFAFLAEFHNKAAGFSGEQKLIPSNLRKWPEQFQKDKQFLLALKEVLSTKIMKSGFDNHYLKCIDAAIVRIDQCISLLYSSSYYELCSSAAQTGIVCHDSFYYQNILMKNNGKLFLIDLDSAVYDIPVYDVGKLLRRLMYKNEFCWRFEEALPLIQEYDKARPLNLKELEVLLIFLQYPQKFLKLGKKKYISKAPWLETKYCRKLNRLERYEEAIDLFIEEYKSHFL